MDDLVARRVELKQAKSKCGKEARAEKRKTTETLRKAQKFADGRPSALHQKYLFIFMMVAEGDAGTALNMLRRESRLKLPWQDWSMEQQRVYIENFVFSFAWPDLLEKIDHFQRSEAGLVTRARTLFAETRTANWVRHVNRQQALTPSSRDVVRFCGARAPFLEGPDLRTPGAQRVWATRWRRRWNGRLGQFQVGEIDDVGSLRQKAFLILSRQK